MKHITCILLVLSFLLAGCAPSDIPQETTQNPTLDTQSTTVVIKPADLSVTLSGDGITGATGVEYGGSYELTISDVDKYDYTITITTAGGATTTLNPADIPADGKYVIDNVTESLGITVTDRTPKTFNVEFGGTGEGDVTDAAESATYGTDYTFTLPESTGYTYAVESITIGETAYTGYEIKDGVVTIPGAAINGKITISISKTAVAGGITVTVEGSGAAAAEGYETSATIEQPYTLTLKPEAGYVYTVTAKMGDSDENVELTVDEEANTYTIAAVTGNIVFTIEREVDTEGKVAVSKYTDLNESAMWLVTFETTLADDKVATYATGENTAENMFWSSVYGESGAYCYLIISVEQPTVEAVSAKLNITEGTATDVDYGMDVNMTKKVDAADAQLVWNMYNNEYDATTALVGNVTMEKFLRADLKTDGVLSMLDPQVIINHLIADEIT
jgi:hypothetical protein